MNATRRKFLKDACLEARNWAQQYATLAEAWEACERPDWMLWALNKLDADPITLRRFACWCVRETPLADGRKVWDLLTDERRKAVEVAEAFCDGKATQEEMAAAWAAAWVGVGVGVGGAGGAGFLQS